MAAVGQEATAYRQKRTIKFKLYAYRYAVEKFTCKYNTRENKFYIERSKKFYFFYAFNMNLVKCVLGLYFYF